MAGIKELRKAFNPTFVIAAGLLLAALFGLRFITSAWEWAFHKEPVPLQRKLDTLPREVGPYRLQRSERLPESVERQLGTENYINFLYRDTRLDADEPGGMINLHAVYYTGNQEPVSAAHVPEICYAGSGFDRVDVRQENLEIPFQGLQELSDGSVKARLWNGGSIRLPGAEVPVREFEFMAPGARESGTVLYFFFYNGRYVASRSDITFQFLDRSSSKVYYCKVEISPGVMRPDSGGRGNEFRPISGNPENTRELAAEFMSWILPEIKACLPDDSIFMEVADDRNQEERQRGEEAESVF